MNNLVKFTFNKVTTKLNKQGIEKKVLHGLPSWGEITKENMNNYNITSHTAHAIICGEISGITVLDLDSTLTYETLIREHPELNECYTVRTKNGAHIYFNYDPSINQTTDTINHIDIRSNGGFVIAPPTTYTLKNSTTFTYTNNNGKLIDFPEYIKPMLSQFNKPPETKKTKNKKPIVPVATLCIQEDDIIPNEADTLFINKIIDAGLITQMATPYMEWIKVGFIIKQTLGLIHGFDVFNKFSKLSNAYDENGTRAFWNTKQTFTGKPSTLATLKKNARETNPIIYKQIYTECYPTEPKERKPSKHELETMELVDQYDKLQQLWKTKLNNGDMEELPDGREIPFFMGLYDGVMTDLDAVRKLLRIYPYFKYCKGILYAFNFNSGLWTNNKSEICGIITKFERYLHIMNYLNNNWVRSEFKSYGNCLNLIENLYTLLKTECTDNAWLTKTQNSGLNKLLFPNGWYEFETKTFYDKDTYNFNPDNVFFGCMPFNFEPFTDADIDYMETIKQRLFYDTIGVNLGNYLILNIARGLAGECMKRIIFAIGDTNSGKGVLTKAISYALGEYCGTFNAESLAYRETSSDEAQQNRWILLLFSKRIIISNEVKSNVKFNGNIIKKIVSGGDAVVGRTHGGEETECITHFLPIVFSNDMNPIVPYDSAVHDRVGCVSFSKHFVKDNPSDDTELLMDPNIKFEVATQRFAQCLVGILLMAHADYVDNNKIEPICEEAFNSKDTWIAPSKISPIELFLQDFEFTNIDADFIQTTAIDDWHKSQENIGISSLKLKLLIKEYAKKHNLLNIYSKSHKIKSKNVQCWHGITRSCLLDNDDDI